MGVPAHRIVAHRGVASKYRGNSLKAITAAVDLGLGGVEFDIQFKGGHPFVAHARDEKGESLAEVAALLTGADIRVFAEIKPEFATEAGVLEAFRLLKDIKTRRLVVTCWRWEWLEIAREFGISVGWVLYELTPWAHGQARLRRPSVIVTDKNNLQSELWPGPWQWCVYDVRDPLEARALMDKGARWIQSKDPQALL